MGKKRRHESEEYKRNKKIKKLMKKLKKIADINSSGSSHDGSNEGSPHLPREHQSSPSSPIEIPILTEEPPHEQEEKENEPQQDSVVDIDKDVLEVMGNVIIEPEGDMVHEEIVNRWTPILRQGIKKEEKLELFKKYLPFKNINMVPPKLNAEISVAISEQVKKRDSIIEERQKQICASLSALGSSLQLFLTKGNKLDIIRGVNDASKLLCDAMYMDTRGRRSLISSVVNKDIKESLAGEPDQFLFGNNLSERIKNAKAVQRSGQDLKGSIPSISKPKFAQSGKYKTKPLNWRAPPPQNVANRMAGGKNTRRPPMRENEKRNKPAPRSRR